MKFKSVEEFTPPKDRLILVTSGIVWWREDVVHPAVTTKRGRVIREEFVKPTIQKQGGVFLVHWSNEHNTWIDFTTGMLVQVEFKFWTEFENPINTAQEYQVTDTVVPNVHELPVYEPSDDEKTNREIRRRIFGY